MQIIIYKYTYLQSWPFSAPHLYSTKTQDNVKLLQYWLQKKKQFTISQSIHKQNTVISDYVVCIHKHSNPSYLACLDVSKWSFGHAYFLQHHLKPLFKTRCALRHMFLDKIISQ